MKIVSKITVTGLIVLGLMSCKKDKDDNPQAKEGNLLVTTMVVNPNGQSGSSYMQLIDNIGSQNITNSNATPIPFNCTPIISGNDIYILPGWSGQSGLIEKYNRVNGELVKKGEYTTSPTDIATSAVVKGDFVYISLAGAGKILVLKSSDMSLVKEIDISSYGVGDNNPDPSAMLIRDNHLFVGLSQMVGGYFPAPNRPYTDLLIIDTDNNKVVKMITESSSGISFPARPIDPNSIFMDENKDIYVVGLAGWGYPGHNAGILRVKAGETDFDKSYKFIFNTTAIQGESNNCNYTQAVKYYKNGIMYATANIPAYVTDPKSPNPLKDRTVVPLEINLAAKTIKKLDFPFSNSFSYSVEIYNDMIIFGLATTTASGFYTYNPATKESSSSPVITTQGSPYWVTPF